MYDGVTHGDSKGSAEKSKNHRFRQELHDDVGVERSDGTADSDFASTFRHRNEHDVHNADASNDERYRSDAGKEHFKGIGHACHRREHVGGTRYRKIRGVRVGNFEFGEVMVGNGLFRLVHRVGRFGHYRELGDIFVSQKSVLQCGDGHVDGVITRSHRTAPRSFRFGDSDDSEVHVSHLDILSEGVFGSKKVRRGRRSEHGDLGAFFDVGLRNEEPILGLDVFYFGIFLLHPVDGRARVDGTHDDLPGSLGNG